MSRRSTSISAATSPPSGVRQPLRDVVHAGLLAVHDAEPVGRRTRRRAPASWSANAPRSSSSLLVSPGLKRTFSSRRRRRPRRPSTAARADVADRVGRRTRPACRAARRAARRPGPASTRVRARPSGRPRWATTTTRAPASAQRPDRRHARADPAVVGDRWCRRAGRSGPSGPGPACRARRPASSMVADGATVRAISPTSATRSTRRLE